MENWYLYKSIQQAPTDHTFFELAKSTFFLNRTNVSGVIKGGVIGGYEQKGKYKIDARFNKKDLVKRIRRIEEFKKRITLSNLDGLAFVRRIDKKTEKIFIYLDPPYYKKGADLYMNFYSEKDHKKLSLNVHKIKKRWMVSYDHHEFILNLYAEKKKILYQLSQSASNRIGDEVLIFADQMAFKNSMNSLSSPMIINS